MLTPETVQRVEQLLAEGRLSQRRIGRLLGISRGTVGAIATGRRPDYEALRRQRQQEEAPRPTGPPRRCPGCGAMVTSDCLACELHDHVVSRVSSRRFPQADYGVGQTDLELRDDHRTRYEKVRARRMAQGDPAVPTDETSPSTCNGSSQPVLTAEALGDALDSDDLLPADETLVPDTMPWLNS